MKSFLFSANSIWSGEVLAVVRIIVGLFLVYHGYEIFDRVKMDEYAAWEVFKKFSSPSFVVYLGKSAELISGVLLTLGLLTRVACLLLAATMIYITFLVGKGIVWYDDQHPFLFVLLAVIFFFLGPGSWSLDKALSKKKNIQ